MSNKPRRSKSREVSSRFLSPVQTDAGAITGASQVRQKARASPDSRKNRSDDESGFMQRLWPASSPKSQSNSNGKIETLADYLGSEKLRDDVDRKRNEKSNKSVLASRQKSCSEFGRFESTKQSNSKENHKPLFGGSMRYTGKFKFPGRSSTSSPSSSKSSTQDNEPVVPGRLSVDENALRRKSTSRKSDIVSDTHDSESECNDIHSGSSINSQIAGKSFPASYMSSTASSRSSGIKVASKYTNIPNTNSAENSPIFNMKNTMRRANSLTTTKNGSKKSKRPISPARPLSPPVTADMKGKAASFLIHKPSTSPSRAKGVGKLLTKGLDLFKSKKSVGDTLSSPLGPGPPAVESVHQLRLMHNRWAQWRYLNARADSVNWNITNQSQTNLLNAMDGLTKLQHSVVVKKLQLQKAKMEMKMHLVLNSQIKALEAWGRIERPHLTALSMTAKCLHAVVCRLPLVEGAEIDVQSASIRLRRASDIGASVKIIMSEFLPTAEKNVSVLSELAEIAAKEKSLLEECLELFKIISTLEIEERSLQCNLIQMRLWQQYQQEETCK